MTTKWAQLPNAVHIDRILKSFSANQKLWDIVMTTDRYCARDTTGDFVHKQGRVWLCEAVWSAMRDINREAHNASCIDLSSVWDTLQALVTYDDCAYMLESDPGELAILAAFGDPRAFLLLEACKIFNIKEETECQ